MSENTRKPNAGSPWITFSIRAAFILLSIVMGYLLLSPMVAEKKRVVGNPNPVARKYGFEVLARVYPQLNEKEIDQLLTESWSRTLAYETFTQFREHTHAGKFVNVDENGFRKGKNQGPWPPDPGNFNIFVFGGSVTFGYGARDEETVPSYLQEFLGRTVSKVRIYNFARGHYYSVQERILYEMLLLKGFVPKMALFIDGSNDFYYSDDTALFTRQFESLSTQMLAAGRREQAGTDPDVHYAADRYLANKKMIEAISAIYGVRAVFAWHPIPLYKYDLRYHLFAKEGFRDTAWSTSAYEHMSVLLKDRPPRDNFLWCADIQEGLREPLYVDRYHYTSRLASLVADCIGAGIIDRGLTGSRKTSSSDL